MPGSPSVVCQLIGLGGCGSSKRRQWTLGLSLEGRMQPVYRRLLGSNAASMRVGRNDECQPLTKRSSLKALQSIVFDVFLQCV